MRGSSVKTLHSILPPTSFHHRTICGGGVCGSKSRVDQAMDVFHSAVNGIEWYAPTLSETLLTQCYVLRSYILIFLNYPHVVTLGKKVEYPDVDKLGLDFS
ncbi:hypothetical protein TNCV_1514381 [Trichonephila clavipes]|nr:hypothetical protein TNCV_1514381 [Trichonephila clavipes]